MKVINKDQMEKINGGWGWIVKRTIERISKKAGVSKNTRDSVGTAITGSATAAGVPAADQNAPPSSNCYNTSTQCVCD